MNKAGFWNKDWCLGQAVMLALLLAGGTSLIQSLERAACDPDARASLRAPNDRAGPFSLAASPYRRACGKPVFEGDSAARFLYKIAGEPTPDILAIHRNLPPVFVAFLEKAMANNSDERYQTGEEFAAAMRASKGSAGAVAGATTDVYIRL